MPEFAFGVNPFQKGSRANPFPPDLPHGQLETPITLTNPTSNPVVTDYGTIPPGGSLQVPSLTDFDVSLISSGLLSSNVTQPFPQMAPTTGVITVNATISSGSTLSPTVSVTGYANGAFSGNVELFETGGGTTGGFAGFLQFVTYGQTSNSGTASFEFQLSSTGGQASDSVNLQIQIEMDVGVVNGGIFQDFVTGAIHFRSYAVSQDPFTGLYVIDQPPTISPSSAGPAIFLTTSPSIMYYSTANQDPTKPIGAIATYVAAWIRS